MSYWFLGDLGLLIHHLSSKQKTQPISDTSYLYRSVWPTSWVLVHMKTGEEGGEPPVVVDLVTKEASLSFIPYGNRLLTTPSTCCCCSSPTHPQMMILVTLTMQEDPSFFFGLVAIERAEQEARIWR